MTDEFDPILRPFRNKIDSLDKKIVTLLVERENIIREVSNVKHNNQIPAILPKRVDEVLDNATDYAIGLGANGDYINTIYKNIIDASCDLETQIFTEKKNK